MLLGHDLRAAVSDILGGLRLLSDAELPPATRLQLERMRAAGEDMARLIEEGLEIVTDQTVGPLRQTVQLTRLVYDIEMRWSGRAQEKGLRFHVAIAPDVPMVVRLDRIALERVLSNLLSNAVKYTDRGTVRLMLDIEADRLRIAVLDDGPGFPEALSKRLFAPGWRGETSKAGNGLGLFISRDMAQRLDGRIEITNRAEGGACVALSLPVQGLLPPEVAPGQALPDLGRMRVLVAEDSALSQAVISHMLSSMGAHCDTATDGIAALQLLENGSYDLAVIDVEMPRLTGIELVRTLRTSGGRHAQIPVVACTAYVLRANRDAIFAAGADAIVSKPLATIDPLAEAIAQALDRTSKTLPLLDEDTFEALLQITGPEGRRMLLERVIDDLHRVERGLVAGLSERNLKTIRADAHVLISVAGSVGAAPLRALAEDLIDAARDADDAAIELIGKTVLAQTDRLIAHATQRLMHSVEDLQDDA
ncbi:ATP-binding protein [Rhodobacter sp. TJ_12]|uniref:ATP-binding protein n=1 Tax=Rhodobacter sp. TJ_12 TaxID=2029399 RepID=UPI001CC0BDBA|nr:ATP-binding protein [Rhodobacter sp. TJ_12]